MSVMHDNSSPINKARLTDNKTAGAKTDDRSSIAIEFSDVRQSFGWHIIDFRHHIAANHYEEIEVFCFYIIKSLVRCDRYS